MYRIVYGMFGYLLFVELYQHVFVGQLFDVGIWLIKGVCELLTNLICFWSL